MKKNVRFCVCLLAVVPFVIATIVAFYLNGQNVTVNHEIGPVALSDLNFITGGATEGPGCYRKIDPECGGIGGKPDRTCPAFAEACGKRIIYYSIHTSKNKGLLEAPNTRQGYTLTNQKCYESLGCVSNPQYNMEYNGNSSSPACVPKSGLLCYSCSNPDMSNPTKLLKSDYRCNDP